MSVILTVYSAYAFQEFYLPSLRDDDYTISIDARVFQIPTSTAIRLEAINGIWHLLGAKGLMMTEKEETVENSVLSDGNVYKIGPNKNDVWISAIVSETDNSVRSFGKIDLNKHPYLTIGSDPDRMIQYSYRGIVGRKHAYISKEGSVCKIIDDSRNGTFVGTTRVPTRSERILDFGDTINIFGLRLVYLGNIIAIDDSAAGVKLDRALLEDPDKFQFSPIEQNSKKTKPHGFKRSPRTVGELMLEPFEIEAPPALQQQRKQPLLLTIGPSFTMIIPMLLGTLVTLYASNRSGGVGSLTGLIVVGTSGLFAVLWALLRVRNQRKTEKKDALLREEQYGIYLNKIENELENQTNYNRNVLLDRYPSTADVVCYPWKDKSKLWSRNFSHDDFLYVRLGIGDIPFQAPINVPKERFSLVNDALAERPRQIKEQYQTMHEAPVGIDLMEKRLVGLFGSDGKDRVAKVACGMAYQIASNNCYTDVRMGFLYGEDEQELWNFAKWLPHTWSDGRKLRFMAHNKKDASDVLYYLTGVLRERTELLESSISNKPIFRPHYVIFISDLSLVEDQPISKYLMQTQSDIGVTTVILTEAYADLPNKCTELIQADNEFCGMYSVATMDDKRTSILFDEVDSNHVQQFVRELSNIRVNDEENGGEIPSVITFLDMYGVNSLAELNVEERWRKNKAYENMRALIGQKAGGAEAYLDIHEKFHGPHGLVAGTTGSGKSELLQTYILSLALNFSPQDVCFFIIDFKGGGMANLFKTLPHLIGCITNLSGNAVRRAMVSIKSEITRRQRIFAELDVNHLDKYMQLYKAKEATIPIPHLLIIIDEFAELKREEPEFMKELISVAQVGRSLGVHLILATQKPAGVVDDSIWSNSKFKLCLRVQDRQDSNDMLKKPDAAYITQTGRCYMQVGNDELYELFQSGWSGAAYDDEMGNMHNETTALVSLSGGLLEGKKRKREIKEAKRERWITQLVEIALEAAQGITLTNELDYEPLIKQMFMLMEKNKIDYPYNSFNAKRIEELFMALSNARGLLNDDNSIKLAQQIMRDATHSMIKLPELKESTQLSAVLELLNQKNKMLGKNFEMRLWLPELSETLHLDELEGCCKDWFDGKEWKEPGTQWSLLAPIGLCDDPANQSQFPIVADIGRDGNIAVCGMAASGKSTFAQTLLYSLCNRYSPDVVNFYIIDYSNKVLQSFENAPHVGGIVTEDEPEKLAKLFVMLGKELDRRKTIFKGGNYSQYVRVHGMKEPAIVCVIDGYANFRERTENIYDAKIKALILNGANFGLYFVLLSGGFGAGDIQGYLDDNIKAVYALEMGDRFKYSEVLHTMRFDIMPEPNIKGRGLVSNNGVVLEFQTALCLKASDDYMRAEMIAIRMEEMSNVWKGRRAKPIPQIPNKPVWTQLSNMDEYATTVKTPNNLPIGYNIYDASLFNINMADMYTFLVAGKPRTGKTNVLKAMALAATDNGAEVHIIDKENGDLDIFAQRINASYYRTSDDFFTLGSLLLSDISERNARKQELRAKEDHERSEIVAQMQKEFRAKYIFIGDLADFVTRIYTEPQGAKNITGFMENLLDKGDAHNIFFVAGFNPSEYGRLQGRKVFDLIAANKTGILTGGMAVEQKLFDFSSLSYKELSHGYDPGIVLVPSSVCGTTPQKALIPLIRG